MVDLFNTGVRPVVDDWLLEKSKEKRDYGDYWSASSAGHCPRKAIFERLGIPHVSKDDDARRQRVFTAGHLFHDWIQGITKAAGISITQELELQDEELMVRGHIDDLVLMDGSEGSLIAPTEITKHDFAVENKGHLILYDYKTRNSKNFNYAKRPSYFHRMQLGTYMYMLRKRPDHGITGSADNPGISLKELTEARILNIEKDTLRMAEVQYMWSDELEKEVLGYWTSLNKHWADNTLPKCTCADHENGFMAKEQWNPYFKNGEPCSIEVYKEWKKENK